MSAALDLRHSRFVVLSIAVLLFAAFACTSSSAETPPAPTPTPTPTPQTFLALADCPIATVTAPYVARAPYLAQPPDHYKSAWYGSDDLWTILHPEGEVWSALPNNGGKFTQKTWWLSNNFDIERERQPLITVTGARLDAPGSFTAGGPGTHGYTDFGNAMLVGIGIPSEGCWEIAAEYKGARLAYVVLVE